MDFQSFGKIVDGFINAFDPTNNINVQQIGQFMDQAVDFIEDNPQQQFCNQPMSQSMQQFPNNNFQQQQTFNNFPMNQGIQQFPNNDFQQQIPINQFNSQPFNSNQFDDQILPLDLGSNDFYSCPSFQGTIQSNFNQSLDPCNNTPYMQPIPQLNGYHYFYVGSRPLNMPLLGSASYAATDLGQPYIENVCHVCFLLDNDLFEYGCPEFNKNYVRRRNVGKLSSFNWETYIDRSYSTEKTPDELEQAIIKSNLWTGDQYAFTGHNCHDFVQFCIHFCVGNLGMARRYGWTL